MNYAPHDIELYRLNINFGPTDALSRMEHRVQVWNLFWLSLPDLDKLPGTTLPWMKVFQLPTGVFPAIVADVYEDDLLRAKLGLSPLAFALWFEREDASIYDTYALLGGASWVETVLRRAHEAHARIESERGAVRHQTQGNVIHVKRWRRPL